ncbi:MAG: GNAT family protein [Ginsengibacter sp.]
MINLEPFEKEDFDQLISWIDNEELLMQFAGPAYTFPLTTQQLILNSEDKNKLSYKVIEPVTRLVIGHAEIHLSTKNITLLCRIIIGEHKFRKQGLGQEIVKKLLNISFRDLAGEKAELKVYDWNTDAIRCYEKAGFTINPLKIREQIINGKTWTVLNMTINKSKWEKLKEPKD